MSKFEEHSCEFKNESDCEEELEERGVTLEQAEGESFGEEW
jgi:hypothetical protein